MLNVNVMIFPEDLFGLLIILIFRHKTFVTSQRYCWQIFVTLIFIDSDVGASTLLKQTATLWKQAGLL